MKLGSDAWVDESNHPQKDVEGYLEVVFNPSRIDGYGECTIPNDIEMADCQALRPFYRWVEDDQDDPTSGSCFLNQMWQLMNYQNHIIFLLIKHL